MSDHINSKHQILNVKKNFYINNTIEYVFYSNNEFFKTIYQERMGGLTMMKFRKVEVIETDDEGFLVLKGILPDGSIIWHRSMGDKVIVMLVPNMGVDYIIDKLTSLHRTLNI